MDRVVEFAGNHPLLMLALVAVLAAIVANEVMQYLRGADALDPDAATRLYNRQEAVFVDLRGENAYHSAHLPGAVNVPLEHLEQQARRLERFQGRPLIVYCDSGRQGRKAVQALRGRGWETVYQLKGGFTAWRDNGMPTEGRG